MELGKLQTLWVEALEAHPEKQGKGVLGKRIEGVEKMCCLGMAGLIAGVCEWKDDTLRVKGDASNSSLYLNRNSYKAIGLKAPGGESLETQDCLAFMNDNGKTWSDIAAILRANPEHYFTHSI